MSVVITHEQAALQAGDVHTFVPYFQAVQGEEKTLRAWVMLSGHAAAILVKRLERDGVESPGETLNRVLLRYGVRRMEAAILDVLAGRSEPGEADGDWRLTVDDVPELLTLGAEKSCGYQRKSQRDLFCMTPAPTDKMAVYQVAGRLAAPTSRAVCRACSLPETDFLCSHLLHPAVSSLQPNGIPVRRMVTRALCDRGRNDEVAQTEQCRAGAHQCWQRIVEAEPTAQDPISPLGLAESFDVLDALWRLAFGKNKRLLSLNTATRAGRPVAWLYHPCRVRVASQCPGRFH